MEAQQTVSGEEFDLTPAPRILQMLGEINLEQWRCVAELVDNSVDGFLAWEKEGHTLERPEVRVQIPKRVDSGAQVTIRDNGPGMTAETLEKAVRAGWSGNDGIETLGMFGMGFNIATARLGTVTKVMTTRKGDADWVGLKIDFEELRRSKQFKTPRITEPKTDPEAHGTRIVIENLKPAQLDWFAKARNRTLLKKNLSKSYAAMLRTPGAPIHFDLFVDGQAVGSTSHCVWGEPSQIPRAIVTPKGDVDAYQVIDVSQGPRPYCFDCWLWLDPGIDLCPSCNSSSNVVERERAVRGWLGIQRYLHTSDFGLDFIRNGRKIEIANKDLFEWQDGDNKIVDYPIDDPRGRGRIVGEIHLDHCRVNYTKDRFDRSDPAWDAMVHVVHGEGPLQPNKAKELGYAPNDSFLARLFNQFRRSSPKPKVAGAWAKLLVVPDNQRAEEMAKRFHEGDPSYQSDEKWYELVEEADRELLIGGTGGATTPANPTPGLEGFQDEPGPTEDDSSANSVPTQEPTTPPVPSESVASLSRHYHSPSTDQKWRVTAYRTNGEHELLGPARPWALETRSDGESTFVFDPDHAVFRSATLTPLDALIAELAWSTMHFLRNSNGDATFSQVFAELRSAYAQVHALDPVAMVNMAQQTIKDVAATLARTIEPADAPVLFSELDTDDQNAIVRRMATRGVSDPRGVIAGGHFLEYADPNVVLEFFEAHPDLFLDGNCWDDAYSDLSYSSGDADANEIAQAHVVRRYSSLLADAVWVANQDPGDLANLDRARLLRVQTAVELLSPVQLED